MGVVRLKGERKEWQGDEESERKGEKYVGKRVKWRIRGRRGRDKKTKKNAL